MEAATVPTPQMSRPVAADVFLARREDLRLVKTPRYPVFGPGGRQVGEQPGECLQFRYGQLTVPHNGEVELENGTKIPSADALEFLLGHRLFGDAFGGFWRVDPVAPPISDEELDALMDAAMRLDVAGLQAIVANEQSGWGREAVISKAQGAIEKIEAAVAAEAAKSAPKAK